MSTKTDKPFEEFDSFEQFFQQAETRVGYWEERAKLEFTREVAHQMEQRGVSKSDLASRLEVRPGFVTRLLSGRNNFEINTMVRLALALDCRLVPHLQPIGAKTFWCDVLNTPVSTEDVDAWSDTKMVELFYPTAINYEACAATA